MVLTEQELEDRITKLEDEATQLEDDIARLQDEIDWLLSEIDSLNEDVVLLENEKIKWQEDLESIPDIPQVDLLAEIDKVGEEIARELGVSDPRMWGFQNNRVCEILWDFRRWVESQWTWVGTSY